MSISLKIAFNSFSIARENEIIYPQQFSISIQHSHTKKNLMLRNLHNRKVCLYEHLSPPPEWAWLIAQCSGYSCYLNTIMYAHNKNTFL